MNNPTQLLHTDIIAVEVPRDATDIEILRGVPFGETHLCGTINGEFISFCEINDDFELLGEATETEISFDVVPYVEHLKLDFEGKGFMFQYKKDRFVSYTYSAEEYFRSVLNASGLTWVNTIEKLDISDFDNGVGIEYDNLENHKKQWQEAEEKKIKGKLIFLKKV